MRERVACCRYTTNKRTRWHKRWFVLDEQSSILYYYKQPLRSGNIRFPPRSIVLLLPGADFAIVLIILL